MQRCNFLWLLPFAPLLGAGLNLFLGKRLPRRLVHAIAVAAMLVASAVAVHAVARLVDLPPAERLLIDERWTLLDVGLLQVKLSFALDPLSAVMILVITLVGTLIHVYSTGYMAGDPGEPRYFAYLNLFVAAMLLLVLGDSLLTLFFGWEGVGLCSYLLIGFWYGKAENARAGTKAFVTNRIGDWGLLMAIALVASVVPTLTIRELASAPALEALGTATIAGMPVPLLLGLGLFLGVAGKSAQLPLYVWLPDAMAGPTPVSALIHAATMVTAGVYLLARLSFLVALSPVAMTVMAMAALATAFLGALFATFEQDLKRVLAYSTVSQLGFMVLAASVGAWWVAIFHLVTHACFKACLFLAAGSVIHGAHSQDMRQLGGLATLMPRTRLAYLLGCLAIAGLPIAAGFYSKDEILWKALTQGTLAVPGWLLAGGALLTAGMTSYYMFRSYYLTFRARAVDEALADRVHESPASMTLPLAVLGAAAVASGPILGWPEAWGGHPFLEQFLAPVFGGTTIVFTQPGLAVALALQVAGIAVALVGWAVARRLYRDLARSQALLRGLATRHARAHALLSAKLHLDRGLEALAIDPAHDLSRTCAWIDRTIVDRAVLGLARLGRGLSTIGGLVDRYLVDGAVNGVSAVALASGRRLMRLQTGRVNSYVFGIAVGLVLLVVVSWVAL